jgi:hypothetical protein
MAGLAQRADFMSAKSELKAELVSTWSELKKDLLTISSKLESIENILKGIRSCECDCSEREKDKMSE